MKRNLFTAAISSLVLVFCMSCGSGEKASAAKKADAAPFFEQIGDVYVGAKSYYSDSLMPRMFYDNNAKTFWHSGGPAGDYGWVSISYKTPFRAKRYKLVRRMEIDTQSPADFVIEGSTSQDFPDNDAKWSVVDEQRGQKWNVAEHSFIIKDPKEHRHYRMQILKTVSDQAHASVAEWYMED